LDELERTERATDRQAGIDRTADQRRADLFAALPAMVLAGRAGNPDCASTDIVPMIVLNVHAPMATVLELSGEPGSMDGYGPVSAEHVRLLRPSLLRRVVIDSHTGRPVAVDDKASRVASTAQATREQILAMLGPEVITDTAEPQHDPSARLSRLIDLRDVRCAGPGCGSTRTHRDHHVPYPEGPTAAWNLGLLSQRCHAAKHHGWTLVRHPDGSTTWTSPLGRTYNRPSPHRRPPRIHRDTEPPPLRPPPKGEVPRWVTAPEPTPPVPPDGDGGAEPGPGPLVDPPF
jgi:hypothetical protein